MNDLKPMHEIVWGKSKRNRAVLEGVGGLKQQFESDHPSIYLYLTHKKHPKDGSTEYSECMRANVSPMG